MYNIQCAADLLNDSIKTLIHVHTVSEFIIYLVSNQAKDFCEPKLCKCAGLRSTSIAACMCFICCIMLAHRSLRLCFRKGKVGVFG